jgi:putative chitinase
MLMRLHELIDEADLSRRGFLKALGATGAVGALAGYAGSGKEPAAEPETPQPQPDPKPIAASEPTAPQQKADVAANQYGSTSMHVDKEAQNRFLAYAQKQGIRGVELAALMSQAAHETRGFRKMVESGSKEYFAQYDGKLGNDRPGDGYRYRGRAYLHITGKWMYARISKALGIDLIKHPELLEKHDIGAKASIWYWNNVVKTGVKDFNDVIAVTAKVQGSAGGLGDRATNFDDYKRKLKI